jgi:hypothetical protein
MSKLVLVLKHVYFDAIHTGQKKEEYRLFKPYWQTRIEGKDFDRLVLYRGYGGMSLDMPWRGYTIKTIQHEHFGQDPVKVFAIKTDLLGLVWEGVD